MHSKTQQSISEEKRKQLCSWARADRSHFWKEAIPKNSCWKEATLSLSDKRTFKSLGLALEDTYIISIHVINFCFSWVGFLSLQMPNPGATVVSGKIPTGFDRLWIQTLASKLREYLTQCSHNAAGYSINNSKLSEILAKRKKPRLWKNKRGSMQLSPTSSLLKISRRKLRRTYFKHQEHKAKFLWASYLFVHFGIVFLFRVLYICFEIPSNLVYWFSQSPD